VCFQGKVHEWGPVVVTYLRKQAIPAAEVTSRLTGKAREVVGAGIGRNPVWFRLTAHFSHVKTIFFKLRSRLLLLLSPDTQTIT